MHWFWRAAIAVFAGFLFGVISTGWASSGFVTIGMLVTSIGGIRSQAPSLLTALVYFIPCSIVVVSVYAAVSGMYCEKQDPETRCRKCGYILHGITEPRCPECGEKI